MTAEDVPIAPVDGTLADSDVDNAVRDDSAVVGAEDPVDEKLQLIASAVRAAQYSRLEELRELLESGSLTPDTKDAEDCTLLQWAAINNRSVVVQELLDRGANVNLVGGFLKETALQWAVRQGALEAAVVLVNNGADPHVLGTEGLTALHLALQFKHADTLLYLCAAHPSLVDAPTSGEKGSLSPLMYHIQMWGKQRPGREASRKNTDLLRALVAFGAAVNVSAKGSGDTALHLCMSAIKSDMDAGTVLHELLLAGADLDVPNASLETPRTLLDRRPRKAALKPTVQRDDCARTVPAATGFWAPWLQIGAGASLTGALGWLLGCAAFALACGALSTAAGATRKSSMKIQNGFASGSIFFIVASGYLYLWDSVSSGFLLWYCTTVTLLVYFFTKTTHSSPGVVRSGSSGGGDVEGRSPLIDTDPSAAIRSLALKGELHASLICHSCLVEKPPRSKHCGYCGHCVLRFDHHCPFVNTCIGRDNIGYFLGFIAFCSLAIGSHLCAALPFIWNACPDASRAAVGTVEKLVCSLEAAPNGLLVVTGLATVHWIWITLLGVAQVAQVGADITTYESIRGDKARPVTCQRFLANLADVAKGSATLNDREYAKEKTTRIAL